MKKIFSFILISFILFINLFMPISVLAETNWKYEVKTFGIIRGDFKTLADCQADQIFFNKAKAYTIGDCTAYTLSTSSSDPVLINNKNIQDQVINVTPKINVAENKSIYKMLAPFAGITCMDWSGVDKTCIGNDIGKYLNIIFKLIIGLCAALAVMMLIIYGIAYMGEESIFGKVEAKSKMFSAVLGLLIALGAWALLNTINPDLTGKNGLNISAVSADITNSSQYRLAETQNTIGAKQFKRTSYYNQIKTISSSKNIPHCLMQVAIQRESGGNSSVGHDEDVPSVNVISRRDFILSGKKFDGTTFTPGDRNDAKITDKSFINTDHSSSYLKAPNPSASDLGLDWRFSHSIGMFGVTFGPKNIDPSGAKNIYNDPNADISKAISIMQGFYNKCGQNIEATWRAYGSGSCTGNNPFTNAETAIRVDLYNQCLNQDN